MKILTILCLLFFNLEANITFKKECSTCHGKKGNKRPMGRKVNLTKIKEDELLRKIMAFKTGKNRKALMAKNHNIILKPLDENGIKNLTKYIKGL